MSKFSTRAERAPLSRVGLAESPNQTIRDHWPLQTGFELVISREMSMSALLPVHSWTSMDNDRSACGK
jgi:hypothetical protein